MTIWKVRGLLAWPVWQPPIVEELRHADCGRGADLRGRHEQLPARGHAWLL